MFGKIYSYLLLLILISGLAITDAIAQNNQQVNPVLTRKNQKERNPKETLAINFYREKKYQKAAELFQQLYKTKQSITICQIFY